MKGKAKQTSILWSELAKELGDEFFGTEVKIQYNYLLNQFKKHNLIARKSREDAVKWPFYSALKNSVITIRPSIQYAFWTMERSRQDNS